MSEAPWVAGPKEILEHGLALLRKDSDSTRRLAFLSIDNAVELTVKTFLGLPRRLTGLAITRKELAEASDSFPRLLDALERHASPLLEGVELGEIEWFHQLRNQLYHNGNGLTIAREQVEVYSELARILFRNLFDCELTLPAQDTHERLGGFLAAWVEFEKVLARLSEKNREKLSTLKGRPRPPLMALRELVSTGVIEKEDGEAVERLRRIRNEAVHGIRDYEEIITPEEIRLLTGLVQKYEEGTVAT